MSGDHECLDVARIQADFPILKRQVNGHRLVYLDSASSAQKPTAVLDAMDRVYRESYANVHRGVYTIAEEATAAFEAARGKVAKLRRRRRDPRDRVHPQRHRSHQPGGVHVGSDQPARGRRHRAEPPRAPRQRRAVAHPRRRARRRAALDPAHRRSAPRPHQPRPSARRRQAARRHRDVQRHSGPSSTSRSSWLRPGPPARTSSSTPARPSRRCPSTSPSGTPTSRPSRRTRSSARPASAPCGRERSCSRPCRRSSAAAR